jgi:hypothetical protein
MPIMCTRNCQEEDGAITFKQLLALRQKIKCTEVANTLATLHEDLVLHARVGQKNQESFVRFHFAVTPEIWSKLGEHWATLNIQPVIRRFLETVYDTEDYKLVKNNCWYIHRHSESHEPKRLKYETRKDEHSVLSLLDDPIEIRDHIKGTLDHPYSLCSVLQWYTTRIEVLEGLWIDIAEWNVDKYQQLAVGTIDITKCDDNVATILNDAVFIPAPRKALVVAFQTQPLSSIWGSCKDDFTEKFLDKMHPADSNQFGDICSTRMIYTEDEHARSLSDSDYDDELVALSHGDPEWS